MNTAYPSSEPRMHLYGALAWLVLIALAGANDPGTMELMVVLALLSCWGLWASVRSWGSAVVTLDSDQLVVWELGKPKHVIDLKRVAEIRTGFNATLLYFPDGTRVRISNLNFLLSKDIADFRKALAQKISPPGPQAV